MNDERDYVTPILIKEEPLQTSFLIRRPSRYISYNQCSDYVKDGIKAIFLIAILLFISYFFLFIR